MPPLFSVVIPAYNQAEFLGDAINSVLSQTYPDFELIVVNDASPDHTEEVVRKFTDPRIKYIVHAQNKGLPATRNTGMRASTGDFIALLDSDDYFHQDKLMVHARYLETHPEVGVTYNPRFELNHSSKIIRNLYRPKRNVDLSDLVLGFPFSPSDMVIRREWVELVGLFDEELINGAEDMDYPCRLALEGCTFASVDQALNYRRYNLNKAHRSMSKRKQEYDMVLNRVFQDPRCPKTVLALENKAFSKRTMNLAFVSFTNEDTEFAQKLIREAVQKDPTITVGNPSPAVDFLLGWSINNCVDDHAVLLKIIFNQFPEELKFLSEQYDWAVQQGYLRRIARAVIWENHVEAEESIKQAYRTDAKMDETFLQKLLFQLIDIDEVLGADACQKAISKLFSILGEFGKHSQLRALDGQLSMARIFQSYHQKNYQRTVRNVFDTFRKEPGACLNRGILSIFTRSVIKCLCGAT